jgi:thymidine phosphorylase
MPHLSCPSLLLTALKFSSERAHYIVFMNTESSLSQSLGLKAESRVEIIYKDRSLIATLLSLPASLIGCEEIGISESAWIKLELEEGEKVQIKLAAPLDSFSFVKSKLYGQPFTETGLQSIIADISQRKYSDIQLTCFLASNFNLNLEETIFLANSRAQSGRQLSWQHSPIVNLHCIGGIPGNRTTLIVTPLVAAFGLTIPKTSTRAITSPAGTADTMEVLAPVSLSLDQMLRVVEKENGCILWGGAIDLSPADVIMVEIKNILNIESNYELVAGILSKKKAMGSKYILMDIPVGPTAKVRSSTEAAALSSLFNEVARAIGLTLYIMETDGSQPIGNGIGPALEARDVLSILRCEKDVCSPLRNKSLLMASIILEEWGGVPKGLGLKTAEDLLTSGQALRKFEAICRAQGGMKEPVYASHKKVVLSPLKGIIAGIHNRHISQIAKLAGAPDFPAAGLDLHMSVGTRLEKEQPLFTLYAQSPGQLHQALNYFLSHPETIVIEET